MRVHRRQLLCRCHTCFLLRQSRAKPEQSCCSFRAIWSLRRLATAIERVGHRESEFLAFFTLSGGCFSELDFASGFLSKRRRRDRLSMGEQIDRHHTLVRWFLTDFEFKYFARDRAQFDEAYRPKGRIRTIIARQ